MEYADQISKEIGWGKKGTQEAIRLLEEGNTIPFIARYRKEATGEMDEEKLRRLADRLEYLKSLSKRKDEVVRLIEEQDKLTPELKESIYRAETLQQVDDLYRPFRPKRKTRAGVAKEKGLEPLAQLIMSQSVLDCSLLEYAQKFINPELSVDTAESALDGAADIIAEVVADDPQIREMVRRSYYSKGELLVKGGSTEPTSFEMYYDYREPVRLVPPHRILAINRGEKEGILQVKLEIPEDTVYRTVLSKIIMNPQATGIGVIERAAADGLKRLLYPSLEREVRNELTIKGEDQAIKVFSKNLRNLLLLPPVRGQVVLAVDPGFRTGSKLAVVDATGKLLEVGVIFPHPPQKKWAEAESMIRGMIDKWKVTVIAIGNGTASRETESFVCDVISKYHSNLKYTIVNEAGASVYSASPLAAKEFPHLDLSYRSGVSIARRLQDPLAELVKIDPKSVGVGQYQHDVNQKELNKTLGAVVESCVNMVGVELNTASPALLQFVAGLNAGVASAIVSYRENKGRFDSRKELLDVPRLGRQTYQQCAGFIRIAESENPLDNTPVHPESYQAAEKLLQETGFTLSDLKSRQKEVRSALDSVKAEELAEKLDIGLPTLRDIIEALKKPGRDPREDLPPVVFRQDVISLEDIREGMVLHGTVRNVVDFGAFVDIGVKQDGLIHISQLSDKYVSHPLEVIAVGDNVKVTVLGVDKARGRISLTMREGGYQH